MSRQSNWILMVLFLLTTSLFLGGCTQTLCMSVGIACDPKPYSQTQEGEGEGEGQTPDEFCAKNPTHSYCSPLEGEGEGADIEGSPLEGSTEGEGEGQTEGAAEGEGEGSDWMLSNNMQCPALQCYIWQSQVDESWSCYPDPNWGGTRIRSWDSVAQLKNDCPELVFVPQQNEWCPSEGCYLWMPEGGTTWWCFTGTDGNGDSHFRWRDESWVKANCPKPAEEQSTTPEQGPPV